MNAYLRALRLERWPRSSAIFLGRAVFVFLHREDVAALSPAETIWRLAAAFLLTWGISTANYVLNEIVDRPFDVHHPTKRLRPLVSGEIKAFPFALIGLLLVAACGGAAVLLFDRTFTLALLSLLAAGIVYNVPPIRTKDIPFLDSVSESVNNPIRFLIGWSALAVSGKLPPLSVLVCWWAFGNFLMVAKRLSEFRFPQGESRRIPDIPPEILADVAGDRHVRQRPDLSSGLSLLRLDLQASILLCHRSVPPRFSSA